MLHIRPVSDLRNKFSDISKVVHEEGLPVFLTKNGAGDMVVMSMEAYNKMRFEHEVYCKLKEAELEAMTTERRLTHDEVFLPLKERLQKRIEEENV